MIPRKIHYCWFGQTPLPLQAKRCLASWAYHLPDYELVRWDESSFDPMRHHFTAAAYQTRYFAFVADYVRMLALRQQGGIYLDVDVEVLASFDPLLQDDFFIGLENIKRFATSIIGAKAEHWLPEQMLLFYDKTTFDSDDRKRLVNVNEVSRLLMAHGFSGNGGDEILGNERVLAIGTLAKTRRGQAPTGIRPLSRHWYAASWRKRGSKGPVSRIWKILRQFPGQFSAYCAWKNYRIRKWLGF